MSSKLGPIFARAGQDVIFSHCRARKKLQQLAEDKEAGRTASKH